MKMRETECTRRRYDRNARFFDAMEWLAERRAFREFAKIDAPLIHEKHRRVAQDLEAES